MAQSSIEMLAILGQRDHLTIPDFFSYKLHLITSVIKTIAVYWSLMLYFPMVSKYSVFNFSKCLLSFQVALSLHC